jgi:hypothetical protein
LLEREPQNGVAFLDATPFFSWQQKKPLSAILTTYEI